MMPPPVSVVIRNYNRGRRLLRAVESVLAQRHRDFELIVVDDASTDDSMTPVRALIDGEPRLRVLELDANRGPAGAANAGLDAARGHYLAFLDSDDSWHPDFLLAHLAALESAPRAIVSWCSIIARWEHLGMERLVRVRAPRDQRLAMLLGGFIWSQSVTMVRRDVLRAIGGFDERLRVSHDYAAWLRIALEYEQPFVHVPRPLVRYSHSADAVTRDHARWLAEYLAAVEAGFGHPAAAPYREHLQAARRTVSQGILARREVDRWLARGRPVGISVVVRTRNRLSLLQRALASVEAQTWTEREIVVVDDGSSDGTTEWLHERASPEFKVVALGTRRGRAAALNFGALAAEGELLAFLDDDDEWLPECLAAHARAHCFVVAAPAFSYCDYWRVDASGAATRVAHPTPAASDDFLAHAVLNVLPHSLSMLVVPRDLHRAIRGAEESLTVGEDVDYVLRLLGESCMEDGSFRRQRWPVHLRRPLVRWHRASDAGTDRPAMLADYERHAADMYARFFASAAGRAYAHLATRVAERVRRDLRAAYGRDFGLDAS